MYRILIGLTLTLAALPVWADSSKQASCNSSDYWSLPRIVISACTALIEAGKETTEELAVAYAYRGRAYIHNNQPTTGIADYNKAISLDPNCALCFRFRGSYYLSNHGWDKMASRLI